MELSPWAVRTHYSLLQSASPIVKRAQVECEIDSTRFDTWTQLFYKEYCLWSANANGMFRFKHETSRARGRNLVRYDCCQGTASCIFHAVIDNKYAYIHPFPFNFFQSHVKSMIFRYLTRTRRVQSKLNAQSETGFYVLFSNETDKLERDHFCRGRFFWTRKSVLLTQVEF